MSLQTDLRQYPDQIVLLFEYDLPSLLAFAVNVAPYTWFVSFNNLYPWIDPTFLTGPWMVQYSSKISSVKTEEGFYVDALRGILWVLSHAGGSFVFLFFAVRVG